MHEAVQEAPSRAVFMLGRSRNPASGQRRLHLDTGAAIGPRGDAPDSVVDTVALPLAFLQPRAWQALNQCAGLVVAESLATPFSVMGKVCSCCRGSIVAVLKRRARNM